ncbi:MAG TPA: hypothetical protein VGO47_08840, partial [Chlamydiales bacterium]|nr:hypothetical protein [Chlamydiales bacterium]
RTKTSKKPGSQCRVPLHVVAGYTVLVVDANILLSSLDMFSVLVDSLKWTIIVPLAGKSFHTTS